MRESSNEGRAPAFEGRRHRLRDSAACAARPPFALIIARIRARMLAAAGMAGPALKFWLDMREAGLSSSRLASRCTGRQPLMNEYEAASIAVAENGNAIAIIAIVVAGVLGFATAVIAIVSRWKDGKTAKGMPAALNNQGKALEAAVDGLKTVIRQTAPPQAGPASPAPEPAEDAAKPEAKAATAGH